MKLMGLILLVALIAIAGCASSDGTKKAGRAAERIDELGKGMKAGDELIGDTVSALNALVGNPDGDLAGMFNTYRNELGKLEDIAKKVGKRAGAVWDQKDEVFEQWEKSLEEIQNEEFRNVAATRKKEVLAAFAGAQKSLDVLQQSFDPLLTNLQDVRTMLTNDLNATGVTTAGPIVKQINEQAKKTRQDLVRVHAEFEKLARTITPTNEQ